MAVRAVVLFLGIGLAVPGHGQDDAVPKSEAALVRAVRALNTPDGSRCLLLATPGPPIVHWVIFTPCGASEDPEGLEGLAVAVARASMAGTANLGSRNRATEADVLARVDENERKRALLQRAGRALPQELLNSLSHDASQAEAVADRLAWERALRQAPALASRLSQTFDGTFLHLCLPVEALGRVAALLHARREEPILRGIHDELRAVRTEMLARAAADPWTPLRDEVRSLAYGATPRGRASITQSEALRPLSRGQALETFVRTQRPDRSTHVLVGGFDAEAIADALVRGFATTKLTDEPLASPAIPNEPRGARSSQLRGSALAAMTIGLRVPAAADPDALAIATAWLAGGEDSFVARWLNTEGVRPSTLRGTYPFTAPAAGALVLLEVAVDAAEPEQVQRMFDMVDAALVAAHKGTPLAHELRLARALLIAERAASCANPDGLATFLAVRTASWAIPPERLLRPLEAVSDATVTEVLHQLLAPHRRVRVTQERLR
jgi:predicted Zn-dependent peptidase